MNFVLSISNHPESRTMLLGIIACSLLFVVAGTGATDISSSDHLLISSEALFIICKNPSLSNSILILSVCLKLILVLLVVYAIHVSFTI